MSLASSVWVPDRRIGVPPRKIEMPSLWLPEAKTPPELTPWEFATGRPTVGTVSGELTASGSVTIDSTTRGIWIVMYGGSNTTFTHGTQTASLGGLSAILHETQLITQVHCC